MNLPRPTNYPRRSPSPACLILLVGAGLLLGGCRGPFIEKTYNNYIMQIGEADNNLNAEVIKDEDITPTVKGSLQ